MAAKLSVAARLDLFGDEAFYWQCAQRLDLAFTDHPPITALLVRIGGELFGDTPLGIRAPFLLLGGTVPLAVFLLTRSLRGTHDAWLALGLSLTLPGVAAMGVVAGPDAPLLAFVSFGLVAFERATRLGSPVAWLLTGLCSALGLATQYRFAPFLLGALLYLVLTARGRACWTRPPLYLAILLASIGLLPVALFNLQHDLAPLRYQLLERHVGGFALESVLFFPLEQAVIVAPPMLIALLAGLWALARRARAGDDRAALLVLSSVAFLGLYTLASGWADREHARLHWPLPGYIALLPALPELLCGFAGRAHAAWRRLAVGLVPAVGALALAVLTLQAAAGEVEPLFRNFAGWDEVRARARVLLPEIHAPEGSRPIVLADHTQLAAQLEFGLGERADVYVLDHRKNREYGRALQYELWGRGESGLRERAGEDALVIVDRAALPSAEVPAWMEHVASLFEGLDPLSELNTREGRLRMLYLGGRRIRPE